MTMPESSAQTVFVVDDDPSVVKALARLLRQTGWNVETYESAESFLARPDPRRPGCLVLDVALPGLDGLELQRRQSESGQALPIVFLTGRGDIPMSVRAVKAGAVDFLTKPVQSEALFRAVRAALEQDAAVRAARSATSELHHRFETLTPREREVLAAVAAGRLNKQIADDLGIVEQTVKFHRARIMERMQAKTVAELMHLAARLGIDRGAPVRRSAGSLPGAVRRAPRP
jgi:FixJ family two-component response regulator